MRCDVRITGWILTMMTSAALTGCFFALPPSRTEVGWATGDGGPSRTRIATGAHLASATPADVPVEVGVGLLYESGDQMSPSTKGPYVDLGLAVLRNEHARLLVGLRGERRWQAHEMHYGTKLRVDLEMFSHGGGPFSDTGSCGFVSGASAGNTGLGIYAEAGAGWIPGDPTWLATMGITVRLPAVAGIAIGGGCGGHRDGGGSGSSSLSNPFPHS